VALAFRSLTELNDGLKEAADAPVVPNPLDGLVVPRVPNFPGPALSYLFKYSPYS
jgi:hypothetical protein